MRPRTVTFIAAIQFTRAAYILIFLATKWLALSSHWVDTREAQTLLFIAAHDNARSPILPVAAIYAAVVGWGIWEMKSWARNILMITSGIRALMWIRGLAFDATGLTDHIKNDWGRQTVYLEIGVDILIVLCLLYGPNVKEAFGPKDRVTASDGL